METKYTEKMTERQEELDLADKETLVRFGSASAGIYLAAEQARAYILACKDSDLD